MSTINPDVSMNLEQAVLEVLTVLTGQTLNYDPDMDRFRVVASCLNRAMRSNALEANWSYYSDVVTVDLTGLAGDQTFDITTDKRFRIINDDAVRFILDGIPVAWAYFLPRDALHKYRNRAGLWAAVTRNTLTLSRPLPDLYDGLTMEIPVMREPVPFDIPADPTDVFDPLVLAQEVDFDFPDVIIARAAYIYAQTDPMMQPRVQTLEAEYKDLMYQLLERDTAFTDTPYQNEFVVPVQSDIYGQAIHRPWPISNRR